MAIKLEEAIEFKKQDELIKKCEEVSGLSKEDLLRHRTSFEDNGTRIPKYLQFLKGYLRAKGIPEPVVEVEKKFRYR